MLSNPSLGEVTGNRTLSDLGEPGNKRFFQADMWLGGALHEHCAGETLLVLLQLNKCYGKSASSRFVSDPKLQSIVSASAAARQDLLPSSLRPPPY